MRTTDIGHSRLAGPLASVRPDRRDWHVAHVPLIDVIDLHWDSPERTSPRDDGPVLWGFTSCDAIVAGELPHQQAANHPHAVRVCILREDNDREIFDRLRLEAGPPPRRREEAHAKVA